MCLGCVVGSSVVGGVSQYISVNLLKEKWVCIQCYYIVML